MIRAGFDLSSMAKQVYEDAIADVVGPESMVSEAVIIKVLLIVPASISEFMIDLGPSYSKNFNASTGFR